MARRPFPNNTTFRRDGMEHCRRASRPGVLWFELTLLGQQYDLPDEILRVMHGAVRTSLHEERDGTEALMERLARQRQERHSHGVEPAVRLWQLLGFSSLNHYIIEKRLQQRLEEQARVPEWVLFGFSSSRTFEQYRKLSVKRLRCN